VQGLQYNARFSGLFIVWNPVAVKEAPGMLNPFIMKARFGGILLTLLLAALPANAHVLLADPMARSNDYDLRQAPCGGKAAAAPVASYAAGGLMEVTVDLLVRHKRTLDIFISHEDFATRTKLGGFPTPDSGIYHKILTLPTEPQGTATIQVTDGEYVSCSDIVLSEPASFSINPGLNDAWYFPDTAGQGFFLVVYPDVQQIFLAWFTYETERPPVETPAILGEPGHRWITAQGPFAGDTAMLDITVTQGGVFDSDEPQPESSDPDSVGSLKVVFDSCSSGYIEYNMPDLGLVGEFPIQRVSPDNVALCEALEPQ
jgi:hypothetical protein